MFELCDHLIGIYKNRNCTKSATVNPRIFENSPQQNNTQRAREDEVVAEDEDMEDNI